jgi:VanZ like family
VKNISSFRWFGWLSLAIVVGYFIVGLWPFDFRPPNRVSWLAGRPGLHFQTSGVAYDPTLLPPSNDDASPSANFTVEAGVEADHEYGNDVFHILTIHNCRLDTDFIICQWLRGLILRVPALKPPPQPNSEAGMDDVLRENSPRFITVRGDASGTDFFLDGILAKHFSEFVVKPGMLDGQLILGNDDTGKHSWSGSLFGLALYNRALDAGEIARHHALWTQGRARELTNAPNLTALYLFNEGDGRQAKDSSGNRHQVVIPEIFRAVHRQILIAPWKDLAYDGPDYSDIAVNILGFVPFGFCFLLYRRSARPNQVGKKILFVVIAGAAVSLTIEIIQAWLPNRDSSMTDLLTNTFGTLLGAVLALPIRSKWAATDSLRHTQS